MKTPPQYRRVAGRTGLFIRHSLWMGADHLLRVRAHPFAEEYRRYYFRDIQAIVLTELPNTAALYGFIAAAFLAAITGMLLYSRHPVWASMCGLSAVLLFFLSWRRPTCACYVKTLVSTEKLPALRRIRKAQRAIALVKQEIESVQGRWAGETPATHRSGIQGAVAHPEFSHYAGAVHWILFAVMLLHVVLSSAVLIFPSTIGGFAVGATNFAILGLAILASLKQLRTDLASGVRWAVHLTLCWWGLIMLASMTFGGYMGFQIAKKQSTALPVLTQYIKMLQITDPIAFFILASGGMFLLWRHQRTFRTPPPIQEAG